MEWNFGADVFLTSIETECLELPAFYYLVKWKSFNTFVAVFLYIQLFTWILQQYSRVVKLYKFVTNKLTLFVYFDVC